MSATVTTVIAATLVLVLHMMADGMHDTRLLICLILPLVPCVIVYLCCGEDVCVSSGHPFPILVFFPALCVACTRAQRGTTLTDSGFSAY